MSVNWTSITEPSDLLAIPNTNTSGFFWLGVCFMIWFVLLATFVPLAGFEMAILVSSFVCLGFSMLLSFAGLIAWQWCLFFFAFIFLMIIYMVYSRD